MRQILCCNVKHVAMPIAGYGHWWIYLCGQSSCINCTMTGCFPDKSIWCLNGHVCQESKVVRGVLSLRTGYNMVLIRIRPYLICNNKHLADGRMLNFEQLKHH